jgi:hypothetical protein
MPNNTTAEQMRNEFYAKFVGSDRDRETNDYDDWLEASPEEVFDYLLDKLASLESTIREDEREKIEASILGELSRSELQATVESMTIAVGHTHSAINGVKNNHNAVLVIAHKSQQQSIDLPREKTITLEEIKNHKLRGTNKALVVDNYALFEMSRDILHRVKHTFKILSQGKETNE